MHKKKDDGEGFPHPNSLTLVQAEVPMLPWAGILSWGLKCTNLWHKYKCGPLLETLNFSSKHLFSSSITHMFPESKKKKKKKLGIPAEPKGTCSKMSANINRTYLFICSSCLSPALAAIIRRNFKHSQLLISYLLILMFIFSHPFQLRLIALV